MKRFEGVSINFDKENAIVLIFGVCLCVRKEKFHVFLLGGG